MGYEKQPRLGGIAAGRASCKTYTAGSIRMNSNARLENVESYSLGLFVPTLHRLNCYTKQS
jgi:hypothetical protein